MFNAKIRKINSLLICVIHNLDVANFVYQMSLNKLMQKIILVFTIISMVAASIAFANEESPEVIFKDKGIIVDGAKLLSSENIKEANRIIKNLNKTHQIKLYLVTSDTSYGLSAEEYKGSIVESWKLDKESVILITVVMEDNLVIAHISENLQSKITKDNLEIIISQTMLKSFQKGNYESGILNTLIVLDQYFGGTALSEIHELKDQGFSHKEKATVIILLITIALFIFIIYRKKNPKDQIKSKKFLPYKNRQ